MLAFTKSTEWSSENEHRILVEGMDSDPSYLAYEDSLAGLVLGSATGDEQSLLRTSVNEQNLSVGKLHWRNGTPSVLPPVWA